jgi:hypothetical protein
MKTPVYGKCGCLPRGENFPLDTRTEYLHPCPAYLVPKLFEANRRFRFALRPQERRTFSARRNARMFSLRGVAR